MAQFQQMVNIYNALGIVGDIAFDDGGMRAVAGTLNSSGVPNLFGNYFTLTAAATAEPSGAAPNGAIYQVGGTGDMGGILSGVKQNALYGTALNPLGSALALPDNVSGQLLQRGYVFVNLPGPANPGDLITYDPATGNLNSITPVTSFTGAIAPGGSAGTPDVLTVSAVATGILAVGQLVSATGVDGATFIISLGTGTGNTGTYNLSTINLQTVSSRTMTAPNAPEPAFAASSAHITGTTLTITTLTSGQVLVGQQVFGTGVLPNTVITALGSGTGGTGTYTVNNTQTTTNPIAMTGPSNLFVPRATVERYASDSSGGVAVIKLSN